MNKILYLEDVDSYPLGLYSVDMQFSYLIQFIEEHGFDLDPDFQRGHVWSTQQQSAYIEHVLRGGKDKLDIYFNDPDWNQDAPTEYKDKVIVDGKQRLNAFINFGNNELPVFEPPVFGDYYAQNIFKTPKHKGLIVESHRFSFKIFIGCMPTRADVLKWYLQINSGGVVHTTEEIERVKKLLENENN